MTSLQCPSHSHPLSASSGPYQSAQTTHKDSGTFLLTVDNNTSVSASSSSTCAKLCRISIVPFAADDFTPCPSSTSSFTGVHNSTENPSRSLTLSHPLALRLLLRLTHDHRRGFQYSPKHLLDILALLSHETDLRASCGLILVVGNERVFTEGLLNKGLGSEC